MTLGLTNDILANIKLRHCLVTVTLPWSRAINPCCGLPLIFHLSSGLCVLPPQSFRILHTLQPLQGQAVRLNSSSLSEPVHQLAMLKSHNQNQLELARAASTRHPFLDLGSCFSISRQCWNCTPTVISLRASKSCEHQTSVLALACQAPVEARSCYVPLVGSNA